MKRIKDSIHDYIDVNGIALDLIDTPRLQRLRRIKQLGTTFHVYPSANHTRFEHTLGVYHLSSKLTDHLDITGGDKKLIQSAALLHDIGHGPFSHNTEPIIERETDKHHTDIYHIILDCGIGNILEEYGVSPERVVRTVKGGGKYGQLLAGSLDIDRMDYLVRDAHHTGVPYGSIDHDRMIRKLSFKDSNLVLEEDSIHIAQSLLTARALMYPTVYGHHATRISEMMLQRATEKLIEAGKISAGSLRSMDDYDLICCLRNSEDTSKLINRVDNRQLLKRAVWIPDSDVPEEIINLNHSEIIEYERVVSKKAGVNPDEIIIEVPAYPTESGEMIPMKVDGTIKELNENSMLVDAIDESILDKWRFGIYAPPDHAKEVGEVAEEVLDLKTSGPLVKERD